MLSYRLLFMSRNKSGTWEPVYRTIAAANQQWASRIGYAMVGEYLSYRRRLNTFVWALYTEDPPTMGLCGHRTWHIWRRVLRRIRMPTTEVRLIYTYRIEIPEVTGFFPWPEQAAKHLCSCDEQNCMEIRHRPAVS